MNKINSILKSPWFWIALLFLIRLININLPPLDQHAWRQSITLGVARNYIEWDSNFFVPRTIYCHSQGGQFPQEFPLFNYLIFIGWSIFGQENWIFRLINLLVSSIGLYYFYRTVKELFNTDAALYALAFFASSIFFIYSRKAMPDTFSLSLVITGVYFGFKYLNSNSKKLFNYDLILSIFIIGIGVLCKIPAAAYATILIVPVLSSNNAIAKKISYSLCMMLPISVVYYWYFIWVPQVEAQYHYKLFFPKSLLQGANEILSHRDQTFERFETIAFQSRIGFYLSLIGLVVSLYYKKYRRTALLIFLPYSAIFLYFMIKSGYVFASHDYYVIPYIPLMAIFGAITLEVLNKKKNTLLRPVLILLILTLGIVPQIDDFKILERHEKFLTLGALTDQHIPKESRILVSGNSGNPMMLYQAHRKGWTTDDRWKDFEWVKREKKVGMDFLIIEKSKYDTIAPFQIVGENSDFLIFKVE